jgi:signal peptidase I
MRARVMSLGREFASTALLVLVVFGASRLLVQNVQVRGTSMYPTLQNGEYILVDRLSYRLHSPQRGDIIIFHPPVAPDEDYVKRIIGLPGDRVQVEHGTVYVDGKRLNEPYVRMPHTYSWGPSRVPAGDLFVLGDNRDVSYDSHWWGYLKESAVIGRAMLSYWPPKDLNVFSAPVFAGLK